jgi:archaellum biogenesis protein FlaJ (TadC family)
MTQLEPTPKARTRQAEPEIIPPCAESADQDRIWVSAAPYQTTHIRMTTLGPVSIAVLMLMIGIMGLVGVMLVLGFALVGLAAVGLLLVGAIVSRLLRNLSRR